MGISVVIRVWWLGMVGWVLSIVIGLVVLVVIIWRMKFLFSLEVFRERVVEVFWRDILVFFVVLIEVLLMVMVMGWDGDWIFLIWELLGILVLIVMLIFFVVLNWVFWSRLLG